MLWAMTLKCVLMCGCWIHTVILYVQPTFSITQQQILTTFTQNAVYIAVHTVFLSAREQHFK